MAEAALNALKKLEANKSCVNCDAYNKFGFQNICEKYKTFVCSNCKSAHQSYSQRVKSVSMSNWTMDEVDALREENGGGNAVARRVWLATWDEGKMRKPTEKDHVDYFKKFINRVYNEQAFYDEAGYASGPAPAAAAPASGRSARSSQRAAQPAAALVNLLDFGSPTTATPAPAASFDAFLGSNWAGNSGSSSSTPAANDWGQFASAPAPAPAPSGGGAFFADFGSAPAPAPAAATSTDGFGAFAAASPPSNDGFGAFTAAPVPAPTAPASFDPFAPTPGAAVPVASSTPASFDPFAPSPSTAAAPSSAWGMGGAQTAAMPPPARSGDFSAFDALAGPAHGHQQPHAHRPYGHGMHNVGMSANPMGMNAMGHMGHGQMGGMHGHMMGGGNAFAQHPRPMAKGLSASIGASSHRSGGYASGGNPGARDPFAGLGLPQ